MPTTRRFSVRLMMMTGTKPSDIQWLVVIIMMRVCFLDTAHLAWLANEITTLDSGGNTFPCF